MIGLQQERSRIVQITCYSCKTIYKVSEGKLWNSRLRYALGYQEYTFTCPKCGGKNGLTHDEFHSHDRPQNVIPVTGVQSGPGRADKEYTYSDRQLVDRAPTNPVEDQQPVGRSRQAIVGVRGVDAHRDHNNWSEIMGAFSRGEKITIVDTWSIGENTWVKLGPERWVSLVQDGEASIELIPD
jgi:hypothetical protein